MEYRVLKNCRVCGSERLREYLNLGRQPLANSLSNSPSGKSKKYPLSVLFCQDCSLSQLSIIVNPEILYKNYPYNSSVSNTFRNHCLELAHSAKMLLAPRIYRGRESKHFALDIASNDGCLLERFRDCGFDVMGVEPSKNLAEKSRLKGIPTANSFWSSNRDYALCDPHKPDVITATNVFAHVHDLEDFCRAVHKNLSKDGIFIIEVPYLTNMIRNNQFDTIYHEHLSYFLLRPLKMVLRFCGLDVFRVEHRDIHGGSIRVYSSREKRKVESSVWMTMNKEERDGFWDFKTYRSYSSRVRKIKSDLGRIISREKKLGKKIFGYGASAKGNTLINYCGITNTDISGIIDDTPDKVGKFTPGASIPILSHNHLDTNHPDYILMTAWNFSSEIKEKTGHLGCRYIYAIPEVRVD